MKVLRAPNIGGHRNLFCRKAQGSAFTKVDFMVMTRSKFTRLVTCDREHDQS